mmetsp:Transcript_3047/g.5357  ORF Transcript_3047/g.5357 Transcript_3047/m.5357 type:complete len:273 (+) Transcript_3047:969-1787(+)
MVLYGVKCFDLDVVAFTPDVYCSLWCASCMCWRLLRDSQCAYFPDISSGLPLGAIHVRCRNRGTVLYNGWPWIHGPGKQELPAPPARDNARFEERPGWNGGYRGACGGWHAVLSWQASPLCRRVLFRSGYGDLLYLSGAIRQQEGHVRGAQALDAAEGQGRSRGRRSQSATAPRAVVGAAAVRVRRKELLFAVLVESAQFGDGPRAAGALQHDQRPDREGEGHSGRFRHPFSCHCFRRPLFSHPADQPEPEFGRGEMAELRQRACWHRHTRR